ncbi:MAG: ABC transporter ATP-binding protein [Caulobacteraceae bacterium]
MNTSTTPLLRAAGLCAGYGSRAVLNDVSLALNPAELLAIAGPNGAGKSTLARVLAGSLTPASGAVELLGRDLRSYDRRMLARTLATVAQENSAAFPFTVLEIVLMGRAPHLGSFRLESAHDLALARAAMARLDILPLAARPIQELSGGERKRVFLARALAQQPRILILDEPTAFLDLRHVAGIFACFSELRAAHGLAVIAILHDLNAAARYADHILLLKDGCVAAFGPPSQVLTPALLQDVYDVPIAIERSPSGAIFVHASPAGTLRM